MLTQSLKQPSSLLKLLLTTSYSLFGFLGIVRQDSSSQKDSLSGINVSSQCSPQAEGGMEGTHTHYMYVLVMFLIYHITASYYIINTSPLLQVHRSPQTNWVMQSVFPKPQSGYVIRFPYTTNQFGNRVWCTTSSGQMWHKHTQAHSSTGQ